MTTKKKTTKTDTDKTDTKILNIFSDVALTAILITCSFTILLFALTLAQKITITVGK
jgi:membrane-bound ClpP family serine protease